MRYRVSEVPARAVGAFAPIPTTNPVASSWGLVKVSAYMGLVPVPAPKPAAVPPISAIRETQPSYVSPDDILPDCYVPSADNMGPSMHVGMAARRQTPIPIPAVSWINTAVRAMRASPVGGRVAMAWPRAFQRWPVRTNA